MDEAELISDELEGESPANPVEAAEAAGLYYVMGGEPGYTRRQQKDEFVYLDQRGKPISDPKKLARIKSLVIPPAWTEVWICSRPNGHIQATGRDSKGRKQYRYHAGWNAIRGQTKFGRMAAFGEALAAIRQKIDTDLRRPKLTHEKVCALVVRLMEKTLIRVGNQEYARMNNSYGLTTLLDDHITIAGSRISLDFIGKKGKHYEIDLQDRRLAALVKRCQELPGQRLFQYIDENGNCCLAITSGDVNTYLRESSGQDFTAKDFRTWGATVCAAAELYALGPASSEKEADKQIVQVVKTVSDALGNTPTICRKYYIHPEILQAYRDGRLFEVMAAVLRQEEQMVPDGLSVDEQAVLRLLRGTEPA